MDMNGAMTLYLNGGWHSSGKQIWLPQGVIATGVGSPRSEIHLADLDGDGLADYLVVDPKSGAVTLWKNGGSAANQANGWLWLPQGKIASGIGAGAGVRFADIDGDGKDDYLWLDENGAVTAYINGGPNASAPGGWVWLPQGVIATGVGAARQDVQFADINGDGKADYLWVGRIDGTVNLWYNGGPGSDKWIWYPAGEVATGTGSNGQSVMFADTTGSGRDDYLVVTPSSGAVSVWLNGCSGGFSGGSAPSNLELTAWGDSYASGVGSGVYIGGRRCLRYDNAYPIFLRDDPNHLWHGLGVKINNVACSGAKTDQVTDYQLYARDQTWGQPSWQWYPRPGSGKPNVGTLSVGGDDIDFPGILNNCIMEGFAWPLSKGFVPRTCDVQRALTWSLISENGNHDEPNLELVAKIDSTIKSIINYARHGGNFYLYVTGYGQFFNDQDPGCNTVTFARLANPKNDGKPHVLMTTELRQDFNYMTRTLNAAIKKAVSQNDRSYNNVVVKYIDIDGLLGTGHRFCEPGVQEPDQYNPNLWFFHFPYIKDIPNDATVQYLNSVSEANVNTLTWNQNTTLWVDYMNEFWSQVDEAKLNQTVAGSGDANAQYNLWPDTIGVRAKVFHPQPAYHRAIYDAIAKQHLDDLHGVGT
ncbi:hypothetical protein NLG97_g10219 [Lecanicillium saksenae]|uniref:Uncharacterized protein n=1 Tax=Lecanicillium saksenae TaxID=468837 RepID=A0ACC1QGU4_9HYPO|nr:hypothetical protein NLG97_g10219 [Lecanicillium saksenae]